jgi:hypothetical protein
MEVIAHVGQVYQKGFCVWVVNVSTAVKRALLNAILVVFLGPFAAP